MTTSWETSTDLKTSHTPGLWLPLSIEPPKNQMPQKGHALGQICIQSCFTGQVTCSLLMLFGGTTSRLGCHGLPIATGRLAGAGHVDRANRVCLACNSGTIGDEKHMIFKCTALAPLRQQHADFITPRTHTMRSFFAHWGF